jgi:RNA polymerase sigma factor (sigma-70 family)
MTPSPTLVPHEPPCDNELLARVRAGDFTAYGDLYQRHREAALRVAVSLAGPTGADDLVADAFLHTFRLLRTGRGPEHAFRAYLFTAVRNTYFTAYRRGQRVVPVEDVATLEGDQAAPDVWDGLVENQLVAAALQSLPERWRQVIRLTTIEEQSLDEVAATMGISTGATAQLAYRAREALRVAYLAQHVPTTGDLTCRDIVGLIAREARSGHSSRAARVATHLRGCRPCSSAQVEIRDVAGTFRPRGEIRVN